MYKIYIQNIPKSIQHIEKCVQYMYKIYTKRSAVAGWRARPGPRPGGGDRPGAKPPCFPPPHFILSCSKCFFTHVDYFGFF